jgi:hypothetical protein
MPLNVKLAGFRVQPPSITISVALGLAGGTHELEDFTFTYDNVAGNTGQHDQSKIEVDTSSSE